MIFLFILSNISNQLDICRQLITYENCIAAETENCRWFPGQHYCQSSQNYALGCSSNLSVKLCQLQISTPSSKQALCSFDVICHDIINQNNSICSQKLNKFGCLSITTKNQFCKWENNQCQQLSDNDLESIQDNFMNYELSQSVCPIITGYLIIHSILAQSYLDSSIDYILLSQDNNDDSDIQYDEGNLQNNYLDSNGNYIWYVPNQEKQYTLLNLKLNDINRHGCLALDIANDEIFQKLFNLVNWTILQGVNHIYCQYININPYMPQLTLFNNNECQLMLENQIIQISNINCQYFGRFSCQLTNIDLMCQVVQPINSYEYSCQYNQDQQFTTSCLVNTDIASTYICSNSNDYCFLDFKGQHGYCDNGCWNLYSQIDCEYKSNCYWITEQSIFTRCSPRLGCNQYGLSQKFCIELGLNCIWSNNKCSFADLRLITCENANTKYSCTHATRQDQNCIWFQEQCLNVLTNQPISQYASLPDLLMRNENQCKSQKGYYRYDTLTKFCLLDTTVDTQDLTNISLYYCLNIQLYTQWLTESLQCIIIEPQNQCDTRILINSQLCSLYDNCYYDNINNTCVENIPSDFNCDLDGVSKEECLTNNLQYCQWRNSKCESVKFIPLCEDAVNVSPLVCTLPIDQKCFYNDYSCIFISTQNGCKLYMNQLQCQSQSDSCYFDGQCKSYDITNDSIKCIGLSKQACLNSINVSCQWIKNECKLINIINYFDSCQLDVNQLGCQQLQTLFPTSIHSCEFQSSCINQTDSIQGCTNGNIINIHRCQIYTNGNCYFQNGCQELSNDNNYQNIQLNILQCSQVNQILCEQITTPGQACLLINNICRSYSPDDNYTCADLIFTSNINICSIALDSCYYNGSSCVTPNSSDLFNCNNIVSQITCLQQTTGQCVFINNYCQIMKNLNIDCSLRNIYACEMKGSNCSWNTIDKICQYSQNYCLQTYNINYETCSNGIGYCFSGKGGCNSQYFDNLPCNLNLSEELCVNQSHLCIWIDNYCNQYLSDLTNCNQAITLDQCLSIQHLSCIYDNNKCIQNIDGKYAEQYQNESYEYCMQYNLMIYIQPNRCVQMLWQYPNNDLNNVFNMQCNQTISQRSCTLQRSNKCSFIQQRCINSIIKQCEQIDEQYHSPLTCYQFNDCSWQSTKNGDGFCFQGSIFNCQSMLLKSLCLKDHGLKCQFINGVCIEAQFTDCNSVANINVNYAVCRDLQPNCFYDFKNNLCKILNRQSIQCEDTQNLYECVFSLNNVCVVSYNGNGDYQSCTNGIIDTYYINLNYYGCTQLTNNLYKYDLLNYNCIIITQNQIISCNYLNYNACIQSSEIECIWKNNECQNFLTIGTLQCNQLNMLSCLKYSNCIWDISNLLCDTLCNSGNCQYSEQYCINNNQLVNLNWQCFTYLPLTIMQCDNIGYSKNDCLNQSLIECYWDGRCVTNKWNGGCSNVSQLICQKLKCQWENNECIDSVMVQNCANYSKINCIELSQDDCEFNTFTQQCQQTNFYYQCNTNLSLTSCLKVQQQICMVFNGQCMEWIPRFFDCTYIYNQYGCRYAPLPCQWINNMCEPIDNTISLYCNDIPDTYNKESCQYAQDICSYDEINQKCSLEAVSLNSINQIVILPKLWNLSSCSSYSDRDSCISSNDSQCEWNTICLDSQLQQCIGQNISGCLNNNQLCKWRNKQCYPTNIAEFNLLPTLISQNVCAQLLLNNIKYDDTLYSCVISEPSIDTCETKGLNKIGCFAIEYYPCYWQNQCLTYIIQEYTKCNQYTLINFVVCQLINNLQCKYNVENTSCQDADIENDTCDVVGLSQNACLQLKSQACTWDGFQCKKFVNDETINQCDGVTLYNSVTCQQISYQQNICIHDKQRNVCIQRLNRFTSCSTPGLNEFACYATILEPCRFENNQCIMNENTLSCSGQMNVNSQVCVNHSQNDCVYQQSTFSCVNVPLNIPCNSFGINEIACSQQSQCIWNYDTNLCLYNNQTVNLCYTSINCEGNCILENNTCRIKHCTDLTVDDCIGTILNDEYCYLDQQQQCRIAKICEDIIFLDITNQNCPIINDSQCILITDYCVSSKNFNEICPASDCSSTTCIMDSSICRTKICSDYNIIDCPNINCAVINYDCVSVTTCSDISDQTVCNETSINGKSCSWQPSEIKYGVYQCTSAPCNIFKSSWSLCQYNEMDYQSCFVTPYASCQSCEDQTDEFTCLILSNGICQYSNNTCTSILCQSFDDQSQCEETQRCYWSSTDQVCRKLCTKIVEEEICNALSYECHWNSAMYQCEQGLEYNPDLTVTIPISNKSFHTILYFSIVLQILFY